MDLRIAWRGVIRNRGFSALVIVTMALGIGANTAIFALLRAVLIRPLPFPDQDRLVILSEADAEKGISNRRVSPANFVDWEAQSSVLEEIGALPNWIGPAWVFNVVGNEGNERVPGIYASSGFFRVLGVQPVLGRTFGREEDTRRGERKVVLSHWYWQERLRQDPAVLGKTIEVDTYRGGKFTIVGVMPEGFDFPHNVRIWLSLGDWGAGPMPSPNAVERCCPWYTVLARLKPGVTSRRAAAELSVIVRGISGRHPDAARVTGVNVTPLRESLVGTHRLALLALLGAVGCVLFIGCANVTNLLLSRAVGKRKEIVTRLALGATPWRIARQLVIESLVLCGIGSAAGVVAAACSRKALVGILNERIPLAEQTSLDWQVLAFAALLTVFCGVMCGLAPLVSQVREWHGRGHTESLTSQRLRQALVVGEVAVAVTLAATAGLLVRTVANLQSVDLGFSMDKILVASLDVTTTPLRERGNAARFLEQLLPRVAALPGVRRVGATTGAPFEIGRADQAVTREGRPVLASADSPQVSSIAVTPGYFMAVGIALKRGRLITEADAATGKLIAILNETAARRYWPAEDPIGKRFSIGSRDRTGGFHRNVEWREVVGVVADVRSAGFETAVQPEIYYPYKQYPIYEPKLVIRTVGSPLALASTVRREIASVNPRAVVVSVRTMEDVAALSIAQPRFRAALAGLFSALALALALFGVYSLLSYNVAQRTREIGIRMAVGAQGWQVAGAVVVQSLRLTLTGVAIGLLGQVILSRWIASLMFGVGGLYPVTYGAICLLLIGTAILASYLPARRAAAVDPATALRSE